MKKIPLTQGKVALVDDSDFERINYYKWFARKNRNVWYALRSIPGGSICMHREILGDLVGPHTDHEDGDGLNNQRYNLRACSCLQNTWAFRSLRNGKKIRFRGVQSQKKRKPFRARITVFGKEISLGSFYKAEDAALVYNAAALKYFGKFAQLNSLI